jgi:glycosyltransferase involved in cell wall biosynthesis
VGKAEKFLLVAWEISRVGGIEEVARQVFRGLEKEEITVKPFIIGKGRFRSRLSTLFLNFLLIRGWSIIVMHPFIFERNIFNVVLKRSWGIKIVWTHGIDVWGDFGKKRTQKLVLADKVIAVSEFTRKQVLLNHPGAHVTVVNNSVDEGLGAQFDSTATGGDFELITVARLSGNEQYKGHDLVLKALATLKDEGLFIKYNIVGKGDDSDRLKKITRELGLTELVIFHGYVPDEKIGEIYGRSSVFVMPSRVVRREHDIWGGEGFGLVYLEAGLYGLPVIACNEGGQTDCIIDEETGYLVNPDIKEIAGKIKYLYENPDIVRQMGNAGRKNVRENFSFDAFKKNVKRVVEKTLEASRK